MPRGRLILVEIFWTAETRTNMVVEKRLPELEKAEYVSFGKRRNMLLYTTNMGPVYRIRAMTEKKTVEND